MTNNWHKALSKWNKKSGDAWCIPKKGTSDYKAIKKHQAKLDMTSKKKTVKKKT